MSTIFSKLHGVAPIFLRGVLVATALLFIPLENAEASRYKKISFGIWKGGVFISNKTGKFSHCAVSARYKSGITLLFSVTRSLNWQIGFSKPSWKMTAGKKYPVKYQVDRHKVFSGTARAVNKKLATIRLPATAKLFNQMRRGQLLLVKAGKDLLKFNLTGTSKMLTGLLRCSKNNRNLVVGESLSAGNNGNDNPFSDNSNDNPFESGSTQPKKSVKAGKKRKYVISAAHRAEALAWYNNTLGNSLAGGGASYRLIKNQGKVRKTYAKHAVVWRTGGKNGILGTLRIFPKRTPESLQKGVLADEVRACKGRFASTILKENTISTIKISRLLVTCKPKEGRQWTVYYATTVRPKGGGYLVMLYTSKASPDMVRQIGERITGSMHIVNASDSGPVAEEDELLLRESNGKTVTY